MMPLGRCLLIFTKSPEKGRVKTRLASSIGEGSACELYGNFVLDLLETVNIFVEGGNCGVRLYVHPPDSVRDVARWLDHQYDCRSQRGKDLGERMGNAFRECFSEGFQQALLLGSDIPDLPEKMIADGFAALQDPGAVIGPSLDGGYYLIGFTSATFLPEVFAGIPWGADNVFEKTVRIFNIRNHDFSILPAQRDMDTFEDLEDLMKRHRNSHFRDSRTMRYLLTALQAAKS